MDGADAGAGARPQCRSKGKDAHRHRENGYAATRTDAPDPGEDDNGGVPASPATVARYAPGPGVLVGAGHRWLLLGVDVADDALPGRLWEALASSVPTDEVLALVEAGTPAGSSWVLADLTPAAERVVTRGEARAGTEGRRRSLAVGGATPPCTRPLAGGVVDACAAELETSVAPAPRPATARPAPAPSVPPTPPAGPLIDGIPPEILAASAPERRPTGAPDPGVPTGDPPVAPARREAPTHTVRRAPSPVATTPADQAAPARQGDGDTDHDGHTTFRPGGSTGPTPPGPPGPTGPAVDHLTQSTRETVLAVHCPAGHVTPAATASCRVCHVAVPAQEPQRLPRPRLGVLHLPDGAQVPLDRGVVIGRQPAAAPATEDWPQLVRLPPDHTYVSRSHLLVELDGWLVLATDLGSRSGTTLRAPGRPPERIRAGERYVWEPGQVLDLADGYEILYSVT